MYEFLERPRREVQRAETIGRKGELSRRSSLMWKNLGSALVGAVSMGACPSHTSSWIAEPTQTTTSEWQPGDDSWSV